MTHIASSQKSRTIAIIAALAVPLAIGAGAAVAATGPASASTTNPSVLVFDQAVKDGSVSISYAYLPKSGYVVIYGSTADGKSSGEPLGSASLKSGDHRNVAVKLNSAPAAGTKLWATLYEDRDGKSGPTKGTDVSMWSDGKLPMENAFTIR